MKNITIFLLALGLAGSRLHAQFNVNNQNYSNSSCLYFDQSHLIIGTNPNSFEVGTSPSSGYQFVSANKVQISADPLNPNYKFHAWTDPGSTGTFHAMIANQQLPLAFLEPSNSNSVPRFTKVEYGLDLSTIAGLNFDERVNNFLFQGENVSPKIKPGTNDYNLAYQNKYIINPYDPDQISVNACFFRPSSPNQNPVVRYGFFYRSFVRTSGTAGWVDEYNTSLSILNKQYEWRIRFAPDEIGTWNGYITVTVDGQTLPQTYAVSFTVVSSSNPGNVAVDNVHKNYLKFSGNNQTYFPIGDNYCYPLESYGNTGGINCTPEVYGYQYDHRIYQSTHDEMLIYLDKLANYPQNNGGNTTRLFMAPWAFQIEREKLNNYDTRQVEMWELDDIFRLMEARGVYCILSINLAQEFNIKTDAWSTAYTDTWEYHPYADPSLINAPQTDVFSDYKGITGVDSPDDFFTNTDCKAFLKKRLRYIVSRWGYSTSMGMYELLTEIDGSTGTADYFSNSTTATNVSNWFDEMFGYMKNSLGDPHVRTGSFTGNGYRSGTYASYLWNKPNIDLISGHCYWSRESALRIQAQDILVTNYNKPRLLNEFDDDTWPLSTATTDWAIHNRYWASAFYGDCGPGLNWDWFRYYWWDNLQFHYNATDNHFDYGNPSLYNGEYEKNFIALRNFTNMIDFRNYNYSPKHTIMTNNISYSKFETYYLVRDDQISAYGWTHNRSFNSYTTPNFLNTVDVPGCNPGGYASITDLQASDCYTTALSYLPAMPTGIDRITTWAVNAPQDQWLNDDSYTSVLSSNFSPLNLAAGAITLTGLMSNTEYTIDWYWTWGPNGGQAIYSTDYYTSNSLGELHITTVPPTGVVNELFPGDWAFVATAVSQRLHGSGNSTRPNPAVTASPNPSAGKFTFNGAESGSTSTITVYAPDGRKIRETQTNLINGFVLDLTGEAEGVYFVEIVRGELVDKLKIVLSAQKTE